MSPRLFFHIPFQPCQPCFSWFTSCQIWAEERILNQIPGPQSLCSPGSRLCRHKVPPEPWLSCCSPDEGGSDTSVQVPTSTLTQPPHSSACLFSTSPLTRLTGLPLLLLGVVSSSRCLPATETCGRKGAGLCCLCWWGVGATLSTHHWRRGWVKCGGDAVVGVTVVVVPLPVW